MENKSKVIKATGYRWDGIPEKHYKTDTENFKDISRYSLLGGEQEELNFHTRYFEIKAGGYSSLELHRHPHSVVIIKGRGSLILGNKLFDLGLHDVVYIAPETIHQFHADKSESLGFLCTVDRYRDKPVIPDEENIRKQITSEKVLSKIRK